MIPCDCEIFGGNCLAVMLLPLVLALSSSTDTRFALIRRNMCMLFLSGM